MHLLAVRGGSITPVRRETKVLPLVGMALGIIVALGGLFLLFAAHQVIPNSIQLIAQNRVAFQVAGYVAFTLGVGIAFGAFIWERGVMAKPAFPERVVIPHKVKQSLNGFLGKLGKIDTLPMYPEATDNPLWNKMSAPVMLGRTATFLPCLLFRLRHARSGAHHVYRLQQTPREELVWREAEAAKGAPTFFRREITHAEDGAITPAGTSGISRFNQKRLDLRGVSWQLS